MFESQFFKKKVKIEKSGLRLLKLIKYFINVKMI
jgi:hypothetical protein